MTTSTATSTHERQRDLTLKRASVRVAMEMQLGSRSTSQRSSQIQSLQKEQTAEFHIDQTDSVGARTPIEPQRDSIGDFYDFFGPKMEQNVHFELL